MSRSEQQKHHSRGTAAPHQRCRSRLLPKLGNRESNWLSPRPPTDDEWLTKTFVRAMARCQLCGVVCMWGRGADTLRATGLVALPETPPYVVLCATPTAGQASVEGLTCMRPDIVLMAVTPVAPPSLAARAISRISVTLGVSFAKKGTGPHTSLTHLQMSRTNAGCRGLKGVGV